MLKPVKKGDVCKVISDLTTRHDAPIVEVGLMAKDTHWGRMWSCHVLNYEAAGLPQYLEFPSVMLKRLTEAELEELQAADKVLRPGVEAREPKTKEEHAACDAA